ncbi:hypothetical protein Tco_0369486, partial [Tanacetum coccineum]
STLPWSLSYASISSRTSSSSAAAGAREATNEGITGETDRDSRDHSGDVVVPNDDDGVRTGVGEDLTGKRTGVSLSSESVPSSSDSVLSVSLSAISSEVPLYLFRKERVDEDAGDNDEGVSSAGGVGEGGEVTLVIEVSKGSDSSSV